VSIADRVEFVAAPTYEAAASLHVLVAPSHHPRQAHWVRRCRSLPEETKRAVRAAAPLLRGGLPEQIVRGSPEAEAATEPQLADYWDAAFCDEWARISPALETEITRRCSELERGSIPSFLKRLAGRDGRLTVVPSVFAHPHTWVHEHPGGGATVVYPIDPLLPAETASDERLPDLLRAIASEVRLTLLKLIAAQPRSTKELADLAYLSEPSVSRHLNQMADVGLLRSRREGYYVVYELDNRKVEDLSTSLYHLFPR
jgi:DNA-binding transcriptional ArsR family regulator